jgi:hypothetical protein
VKRFLELAAYGFFVAIALVIIFVQAGTTGESGGKQSADILSSGSKGLAEIATALEGRG